LGIGKNEKKQLGGKILSSLKEARIFSSKKQGGLNGTRKGNSN
jgi:hypothetical protein